MAFNKQNRVGLPPEANRILYVKGLPAKISPEELYDIFGRFGAVRQIRTGCAADARGTAFVVYEDVWNAKCALESLSGFNVKNRYLVIFYHRPHKTNRVKDVQKMEEENEALKRKYGLETPKR